MKIHIARRDEEYIGRYKITILYDVEDRILGAIIETPRATRPIYIAIHEEVKVKLPKQIRTYLRKLGFKVTD